MMRTTSTRAQESHPSHREITVGGSQLEFLLKKKTEFYSDLRLQYTLALSLSGRPHSFHTQPTTTVEKKKQERELASLFPVTIALLTFGGYTP